MTEISLCANAKLNLYLDITGKRGDGYHLLETVMQSVDLCDIVNIKVMDTADRTTVGCSNPLIPKNKRNICHRAANMFFTAVRKYPCTEIFIDKRIPHAAGLGGGSADAAAVLTGLNAALGEPLDAKQLQSVAVKVGADVPFCLAGGIKICRGIGDELSETEPLPERRYLIIMPDFYCDTHGAYVEYDENPLPRRGAINKFLKSGEEFPKKMYNVFKEIYENEKINAIVKRLLELGAQGADLSGSGSAVFGVFADDAAAAAAAKEFPQYFTAVCKPVSEGINIIEQKTL